MNYRLKGLAPLLGALARVPGLELIIAGHPNSTSFVALAKKLRVSDRAHFIGYCADMRDAYAAADFLVHPTFYDPCANVVLEALAAGLPVITTSYNGASEMLQSLDEDGTCAEGYVIHDPHDQERLAWCLAQLLDPDRRARCSAAARVAGAAWTFEDHFQGLMAILREAAGTAVRPSLALR
jgi:UDP-glucose:(heptosyl)LPS alpha-1,3-glucosyltransferase